MNNSVSVDSNVLETIISNVNSDSESLKEISTSLESDFQALTECGLFENCLNSLKEEAKNIDSAYSVLVSSLKSHIDDYNDIENQLKNVANNYRSYYTPTGGSPTGSTITGPTDTVPTVDDSTPVDPEKMDDKIPKLDINSIKSMISFISLVKDNKKSIVDILFDESNANYLCTLLQKFYLTYGNTKVEYNDASSVQKAFLKTILNTDQELPKILTEHSLLKFKTYLKKIAKDNNIDVYDLVMDDKYKDILKESLNKLYNKEVEDSSFDDNYKEEFIALIDTKAKEKNVDKEKLFEDVKLLL